MELGDSNKVEMLAVAAGPAETEGKYICMSPCCSEVDVSGQTEKAGLTFHPL